jgi:glyoxylase-like metal-dependent hydrolase (beta-lactamase superfamily II)
MQLRPRSILAPNASPMTLDGTITYLVGERRVAIIDPGCADRMHIDAIAAAAAAVREAAATILLTHHHPDHAAGALELGTLLQAPVLSLAAGTLHDGQAVSTDAGELVVLATPGHAPDHAAFHWPAADAIFCGDLMMGGLDTTVVGAPEGDLGAYLESLDRLRAARPRTIYPSHGPPFTDPDAALDRYVEHRAERERQVLVAVAAGARSVDAITDRVYGPALDEELRPFATAAVEAYLEHLRRDGRLPDGATW